MKQAGEVLVLGAAVIDIAASPVGQSMDWKEKQRIDAIRIATGGDAANQCVHIAALGQEFGIRPSLVTCVGADGNGSMLRTSLAERGVDISRVRVREEAATGTALVLVDETGERHIFSVKGAHSLLSKAELGHIYEDIKTNRIISISIASIFQMPELERDGLEELLRTAREHGVPVFADLGSDKLELGLEGIRRFLPYIDYFLPSAYDILGKTGSSTPEEAARKLRELGCSHVLIKCGADGCFVNSPGYIGRIPAIPVRPVDTTGAGDCMSAVFLVRILAGDTVENAARYACAAGSLSTLYAGASEIRLKDEEIRAFMKREQKWIDI